MNKVIDNIKEKKINRIFENDSKYARLVENIEKYEKINKEGYTSALEELKTYCNGRVKKLIKERTEPRTLIGHQDCVYGVSITPDGKQVVSASNDDTIKVWDLETGKELRTLTGHSSTVKAVSITPDGKTIVSASCDETLKVWDMETGKELRTLTGHSGRVVAVSIAPDGKTVVSASSDDTLKVWDIETGKELRTLTGHRDGINGVSITPDGKQAVSVSYDHTVRVWDLETGEELKKLIGHYSPIFKVSITPDGKQAVSASHDGTLTVWDLGSGKEIRALIGHSGWVGAVSITPDGKQVVSGSCDHTLKIWDLETGKELRTLIGHSSPVEAVSIAPDGKTVVSASSDDTLKVWDIKEVILSYDLSGCYLDELPKEIEEFTNLRSLDLRNNRLKTLPPEIGNLVNLSVLKLADNPLETLPVELYKLKNITNIDNPPTAIFIQGIDAVNTWLNQSKSGEIIHEINEVKVIIVGDGEAGKTNLIHRIMGRPFSPNEPKTHGIKIETPEPGKWGNIKIHFWDFGGQQIMHAAHTYFLSENTVCILLLDGRNDTYKEERAEYWLKQIQTYGKDSPIVVVMNKIDENQSFDINRTILSDKFQQIKGYFCISCKDDDENTSRRKEFFEKFIEILSTIEFVTKEWPDSWLRIRGKLERITEGFISMENYLELCRDPIDIDEKDNNSHTVLLKYLHNLGIMLYYDYIQLEELGIIKPEWAMDSLYSILNSNEVSKNNGIVKKTDLMHILDTKVYPVEKHDCIIRLIEKFELCYTTSDRIFIPCLFQETFHRHGFNLKEYRYVLDYNKFLPPCVILKFIVKQNQHIVMEDGKPCCWRSGVLLRDDSENTEALVQADVVEKKINIWVRSIENNEDKNEKKRMFERKQNHVKRLLETFNSINKDIKDKLNGNEEMIIAEHVSLPDEPETTFDLNYVLEVQKNRGAYFYPKGAKRWYSIKELLKNTCREEHIDKWQEWWEKLWLPIKNTIFDWFVPNPINTWPVVLRLFVIILVFVLTVFWLIFTEKIKDLILSIL